MKKIFALVLVAAITIASLCACSNNTVNLSEKALAVAKSAIEATDNYLDSKIGYDEVSDKLSELDDEMSYVAEKTAEHHSKCPGCNEIISIIKKDKSGKSQAQWKRIAMSHYIYTLYETNA